ncbi:Meteorin-like protein [Acipenser ruthenus]|uniref:Meteorin-like protein n=1 Tax=Acipenser ruthenus TaxID=7906 RepID=A0A662YV64_ACIRT|nr:Meteorin-like protein [Acipenser ruthenus]
MSYYDDDDDDDDNACFCCPVFVCFCLQHSGLSREAHSGTVEQVRLRCTGGSVEWMYPTQALRVILEPNLSSARHTTVCIKPFRSFSGANIYVERAGELDLLVNEQAGRRERVYCFRADNTQHAAVFLQASPQKDISRRTVGFQYELLSNHSWKPDFHRVAEMEAVCRPCNNTELLMAICSSDFATRTSALELVNRQKTEDPSTKNEAGKAISTQTSVLLNGPFFCREIELLLRKFTDFFSIWDSFLFYVEYWYNVITVELKELAFRSQSSEQD